MASAIQSTCCSIDTIMLLSTDGLPGPVISEQVREPGDAEAEVGARAVGPLVRSVRPPRPRMSIASSAPVIASKPVANTMASTGVLRLAGACPLGVISLDRRRP